MSFLLQMYERMRRFYENRETQSWWPSDPLEVIVGAVLVQGTKWGNVAHVLENLKADGLLDFRRLLELDVSDLEERIRSVGFQQRKAPALKGVLGFLQNRFDGDLDRFFLQDSQEILQQLLNIKGIGPQTAQNILQYGGNRNLYAVDKFTFRVFLRHGIIGKRAKSDDVQRIIGNELQDILRDESLQDEQSFSDCNLFYNEFQSLLVRIGRDFCGKTGPDCRQCPLKPLLPVDGPLEVHFDSSFPSLPKIRQNNDYGTNQGNYGRQTQEIFSESAPLPTPGPVPQSCPKRQAPPEPLELNEQETKVFSCVASEGTPIDMVIVQSGLPTGQVLATLFALEMKKLVKRCEGNMVVRN